MRDALLLTAASIGAFVPIAGIWLCITARRASASATCQMCGYDLRGRGIDKRCSECGAEAITTRLDRRKIVAGLALMSYWPGIALALHGWRMISIIAL